jgi:hypothetical protein
MPIFSEKHLIIILLYFISAKKGVDMNLHQEVRKTKAEVEEGVYSHGGQQNLALVVLSYQIIKKFLCLS